MDKNLCETFHTDCFASFFDFYDCLGVKFDGTEKFTKMYSAIFKLKIIGKRFISSSTATLKGQIEKWLKRFRLLRIKTTAKTVQVWDKKSLLCHFYVFFIFFKWFHCWYSFQFIKLSGLQRAEFDILASSINFFK